MNSQCLSLTQFIELPDKLKNEEEILKYLKFLLEKGHLSDFNHSQIQYDYLIALEELYKDNKNIIEQIDKLKKIIAKDYVLKQQQLKRLL